MSAIGDIRVAMETNFRPPAATNERAILELDERLKRAEEVLTELKKRHDHEQSVRDSR